MTIAVDLDNTLADTNAEMRRLFPGAERLERFVAHWAPVTREWWAGAGLDVLERARPLPGAVAGVQTLARHDRLIYLTSRPVQAGEVSRRWLRAHGFPEAPIVFAASARKKAEYARLLGVEFAIDDDPAAAKAYRRAGIAVLLPRQPYNARDPLALRWEEIPGRVPAFRQQRALEVALER
ncbi:MAG: hypothetical protein K6U79_11555 [Firmicutes bacterium]|nr:hypothetical protein [Bacillota bacterium]